MKTFFNSILSTVSILCLGSVLFFSACSNNDEGLDFSSGEGRGGSLARFTFLKGYLYVVDNSSLKTFDISNPEKPTLIHDTFLDFGVETIFPYENYLFLGTQFGMYIFSVEDSPQPIQLSRFEHAYACDPVVVSHNVAYVTLRSGTSCATGPDRLEVVDVSDYRNPTLIQTIDMYNPHGLATSDTILFVCEANQGIKVFNIKNRREPDLLYTYDSLHAVDVIANYGKKELIVTGNDGIYQLDYQDPMNLRLLSKIENTRIND